MKKAETLPIISFETQQDWERWLTEHHTETEGLWLKIAKKEAGISSVNYAEALESAICYGWIDGKKRLLMTSTGYKNSRSAAQKASGQK